ncbi:MAG: FHA domain-containing protein [Chloroflexota bacterium]|nr:FHA domain-containing protein [Chloroflexota bacterium]
MNAIIALILRLLLIFLSYLFVGWIGYTIFKDLKYHLRRSKSVSVPPITLDTEGAEEIFHTPEIILGRDPACDFPLSDDAISLRHCKINYHHNQWWAEDLDSTNGSFLNDSLIKTPIVLANGDVLKMGRIEIAIKLN